MKRVARIFVIVLVTVTGLGAGLTYTWVLDPVEYYDTAPDSLYIEDKLVYLALIGDLYVYEGDLAKARGRLGELGVEADGPILADLIESYLDSGGQPEDVRNLARLAEALGANGGVLLVFGPGSTPAPQPTPTPTAPPGASPTPFPSATPLPSFRLVEQTAICADPGLPGQIAIWVQDAEGNELAGVEVVVSWIAGQDRLFTGLQPEQGMGYADFEMSPDVEYDVTLADFGGDAALGLASTLSPGICPSGTVALNWRLSYQETP
jgi:hypothetical protein